MPPSESKIILSVIVRCHVCRMSLNLATETTEPVLSYSFFLVLLVNYKFKSNEIKPSPPNSALFKGVLLVEREFPYHQKRC
jgi:hypothetical protein